MGDRRRASRGGEPSADDAYQEALGLLRANGSVREHAGVLRAYGRYLREARPRTRGARRLRAAADVASNLQSEPTSAER